MFEADLSEGEHELLRQLIIALRSIRYGSLILTVHEGQLVEIQKTEKIRMRVSKASPGSAPVNQPVLVPE